MMVFSFGNFWGKVLTKTLWYEDIYYIVVSCLRSKKVKTKAKIRNKLLWFLEVVQK